MNPEDPVTQAEDAVIASYGRELARTHLIEPTYNNGCEVTPEIIGLVMAMRASDSNGTLGMVCSLIEEAAGILRARRLETERVRSLELKLAATEAQLRALIAQYVKP